MTTLAVPFWVWAATIGALVLLLGTELVVGIRHGAHEVSLREAALWTAAVVALAVVFGLSLAWLGHQAAAGQFFAGWLTEYSLSLDNLFIFVLLIGRSAVPSALHSRIPLLGIVIALVLRGIFIAVGASAISRFSWILYVFGALLIGTAVRLAVSRHGQQAEPGPPPRATAVSGETGHSPAGNSPASAHPAASPAAAGGVASASIGPAGAGQAAASQCLAGQPPDGALMRMLRRFVPVSPSSDGGRLLTRVNGRRMATPVLFLIIAIAATDLVFALDSIPAIFGLTRDPYLVFTANMFALLGLRQLYFLIGGLLGRLAHLSAGLAVILGFIGFKLITEALLESGVRHVGPLPVPHISTTLSLAVIGGVLTVVIITSLRASRRTQAVTPVTPAAPDRSDRSDQWAGSGGPSPPAP